MKDPLSIEAHDEDDDDDDDEDDDEDESVVSSFISSISKSSLDLFLLNEMYFLAIGF